tara:strand:+ start:546 stop:740 length:195 start_codon:yes stop_codon:yes gene_type:complete
MVFENNKDKDILELMDKCEALRKKINNSVNKLSEFVLSSIMHECCDDSALMKEMLLEDKDIEKI